MPFIEDSYFSENFLLFKNGLIPKDLIQYVLIKLDWENNETGPNTPMTITQLIRLDNEAINIQKRGEKIEFSENGLGIYGYFRIEPLHIANYFQVPIVFKEGRDYLNWTKPEKRVRTEDLTMQNLAYFKDQLVMSNKTPKYTAQEIVEIIDTHLAQIQEL